MTTQVPKPSPVPDEASKPYFEAAAQGKLALPRCNECKTFLHPGAEFCTECLADDLTWTPVSGRGTLFTFGVMHQQYHPGFVGEIPYNVAQVELEEGPRLQTNIVGVKNEDLKIGMKVVATFEQAGPVKLVKFKPAGK